jgi:hypothetical protein
MQEDPSPDQIAKKSRDIGTIVTPGTTASGG